MAGLRFGGSVPLPDDHPRDVESVDAAQPEVEHCSTVTAGDKHYCGTIQQTVVGQYSTVVHPAVLTQGLLYGAIVVLVASQR